MVSGQPQKVQPKVYQLILFMLENRDRAVSKDEIQDAIWPDVEVSETAMTRAIMKARKLLQQDGEVIKTIHGHGYHFIAEVTVVESLTEATASTPKKVFFYVLSSLLLIALSVTFMLNPKVSLDSSEISVAVLPVIDRTEQPDLAWAGLGLMSLTTQMIKSDNSVATVSNWKTAQVDVSTITDDLTLTDEQLSNFKQQLEFTHLLIISLEVDEQGLYQLRHAVYHPNGRGEFDVIEGDNPTAMVQKMTQQFLAALPNKTLKSTYRSISEDVFTNELYSRGMGFQMMGDAKKAREYFQLAVNEDRTLFWPRYELALTTRKLGLAKESEQELLALKAELDSLTDEPAATLVLSNALGSARMRLGDNDGALQYYLEGFEGSVTHKRYDYQTVMAGNVALIYKRMKQYDKAKTWVARSIEIHQQQGIEMTGYTNMLLGQIENLQGNNEAALNQLNQAISLFEQRGARRFVASALSEKAQILLRQGFWQHTNDVLLRSNQIKADMSDKLGVISGQLSLMDLYIDSGRWQSAEALVEPILDSMKAIDNHTYNKFLVINQAKLAFLSNKYEQALAHIATLNDNKFNRRAKEIELKSLWLMGKQEPLNVWLAEYQQSNQNDNSDTKDYLLFIRLKRFVAEQSNSQELMGLLKTEAKVAKQVGQDAMAIRAQIKQAQLLILNDDWEAVADMLRLFSLIPHNWWEMDWLEAQLLFHNKDVVGAQSKAQSAKQKAHEAWTQTHQSLYNEIIDCCQT